MEYKILNKWFNKQKPQDNKPLNVNNRLQETEEEIIKDRRGRPIAGYEYREPTMFGITLSNWRNAVEEAWSEIDPKRTDLCDIYKAMTSYDSQTIAGIQQRKLFTMQGDLALYNEDGTINEELTKLLKTPSGSIQPWLKRFISYSLDSIFWGYEVLAINYIDGKVEVKKLPERNILPREGAMMIDTYKGTISSNLLYFNDGGKYDLVTCKISYTGEENDLGLLSGCAPYFFSKITGTWKQHADKFGMLTRVLKTDSEISDKLTSGYQALKNQVRGNFLVIGKDEELTFEGDTRTDIGIYKSLNEYCDWAISKILLGQTSTLDEKAYSGSAEIHKEILDSIIKSDREFIEEVVNDQLLPKLKLFGLIPQNTSVYFGISETVNTDLTELSKIVDTLSKAGFKATKEYIQKTFNIELEDVDTSTNNQTQE